MAEKITVLFPNVLNRSSSLPIIHYHPIRKWPSQRTDHRGQRMSRTSAKRNNGGKLFSSGEVKLKKLKLFYFKRSQHLLRFLRN